jgi:hypothetical protein
VGTYLLSKMSLNVITVKAVFAFCISKHQFLKNLCSGTHRGGFQFLQILDLWTISFHAVIVSLCKNLLLICSRTLWLLDVLNCFLLVPF